MFLVAHEDDEVVESADLRRELLPRCDRERSSATVGGREPLRQREVIDEAGEVLHAGL